MAIEADGDTHFKHEELAYDRKRQNDLEVYGIHFQRFTNVEVFESIDYVVEIIRKRVKELLGIETPTNSPFKGEGN